MSTRYQSKYRHNHLHIDGSRKYLYYVGTNWDLYQIQLDGSVSIGLQARIFFAYTSQLEPWTDNKEYM